MIDWTGGAVRNRRLLEASAAKRAATQRNDGLRTHLIDLPPARAAFSDPSQLVAALCSRRAGKTTEGNVSMLELAAHTKHGRFIYINETRNEVKRLAWHGAKRDGMKSLAEEHKLNCRINESDLTICFEDLDSWIYFIGVDDERAISKALGTPYHRVWWDEAQKIPAKFEDQIKAVLLPSLLDYGGQMILSGTPNRQTNGLFFRATHPDPSKRAKGWSFHHWSMLDNPFFGKTREERQIKGVLGLQALLGGPEAAPLDSPAMLREASGHWTFEDANFVYHIHKAKEPTYAPVRLLPEPLELKAADGTITKLEGFPDIAKCLADLPFTDPCLALGVDLGYSPDPFAFVLWAWDAAESPTLYEVCSWSRTELDSDQQALVLHYIRSIAQTGLVVADAGGGGKQTVAGWSKQWIKRYGQAIIEATKVNKHGAIEQLNTDIVKGHIKLREGGALQAEWQLHMWGSIKNAHGNLNEDPTTPNHCSDAGLYAHRETWQHRFVQDVPAPEVGSAEYFSQLEQEIELDHCEADQFGW